MKVEETIINLILKLTQNKDSIFIENLILEAGESGIGEQKVEEVLSQLKNQKVITEPLLGVIKKI